MRSSLAADRRRDLQRRLRRTAGWSIAFAIAFSLIFVVSVLTRVGQYTDAFGLGAFDWLPPSVDHAFARARTLIPSVLGVAAVVLGIIGARRGLMMDAAVGASAIVGAYAASSILKYLVLERPYFGDFGYLINTYPSGHVAVSALAGVMVVRMLRGTRIRLVAACCVVTAVTLVGIASVTTIAHRPSDVLGGIALAGIIAPWAARMRVASLRQLRTLAHGPTGTVAAVALGFTALAPLGGAIAGTIASFATATLAGTWLVVWVATAIPVTPRLHPQGRQRPEA